MNKRISYFYLIENLFFEFEDKEVVSPPLRMALPLFFVFMIDYFFFVKLEEFLNKNNVLGLDFQDSYSNKMYLNKTFQQKTKCPSRYRKQ